MIYINAKTNQKVQQYIFFEKLPLKQSNAMAGYFKPLKDEIIRDFLRTFIPEVVMRFIQNLRYVEIESQMNQ